MTQPAFRAPPENTPLTDKDIGAFANIVYADLRIRFLDSGVLVGASHDKTDLISYVRAYVDDVRPIDLPDALHIVAELIEKHQPELNDMGYGTH